jgi:DNA-binding transcriptional regulator/RsmH inhibitor MraZ
MSEWLLEIPREAIGHCDSRGRMHLSNQQSTLLDGNEELIVTVIGKRLLIYAEPEYREWAENMLKSYTSWAERRRIRRVLFGGAFPVTIDRQRRLPIPRLIINELLISAN